MNKPVRILIALSGVTALATTAFLVIHGLPNTGRSASPATQADTRVNSKAGDTDADHRIVMTVKSAPSLKHNFSKISEPAASPLTKAIVEGTVTKVQDLYVDGVAYRVLTVDVKTSRKTKVGTTVTLYEDGGVVPYADILPDLQAHSETKLAPAASDKYVDFQFMGAPHTEIGNEIVAFIQPNPNGRGVIPADYQLIGSVQGLLVKDASSGDFLRRGVGEQALAGTEQSLSPASLDATLTKVAGKAIG